MSHSPAAAPRTAEAASQGATQGASTSTTVSPRDAWLALIALCLGFFMILVDQTIVAVATPDFVHELGASVNDAFWVTSAYLLAYSVPLLFAGRLGDHYGQGRLYIVGVSVFTVASVACGMAGSVEVLIAARVLQGLGAALISPQTLSTITRIVPAENRGTAMGVWGAVAGIATLTGPIAGGAIVSTLGWRWIFFVNVPVGVLAVIFALRWVPTLPTHAHRHDVVGIVLSGLGLLGIVYGVQQGGASEWPLWSFGVITAGVIFLAVFVAWEWRMESRGGEPLMTLSIFRDRNFSLANIAIATMGFTTAGFMVPLMLFFQVVRGLGPMAAGLMMAPMAIISGVLAPVVGRLVNHSDPRFIAGIGYGFVVVSLVAYWGWITPETPLWHLLVASSMLGVANAFVWAPTSTTAMRNLSGPVAGAGSGVYNSTRQIGAVVGASSIAAVVHSVESSATGTPMEMLSTGISQSMLLPAAVMLCGVIAALFFRPAPWQRGMRWNSDEPGHEAQRRR